MILIKLALVLFISSVYAGEFQWVGNSAENCDFHGIYLKDFPSTKAECGPKCAAIPECTHYAWGPFQFGGNCVLKQGPVTKSDAHYHFNAFCGIKEIKPTVPTPTETDKKTPQGEQSSKLANLINQIKNTNANPIIVLNL